MTLSTLSDDPGKIEATTSAPATPSEVGTTKSPPLKPQVVRKSSSLPLIIAVVVVLAIAGIGAGWYILRPTATKPLAACSSGNQLQGEGASFLGPLMSAWASPYSSATGNEFNYNPAGSGKGVTAITDNQTDFAATDEPLSSSQISGLHGNVLLTLPVVGTAEAVIYNVPGIAGGLKLTGPLLAEIYLGQVSTWDNSQITAINPSIASQLPSDPITVVYRTDNAGANYVFTNFLSDSSHAWATGPGTAAQVSWPTASIPHPLAASSNSVMLSEVSTTDYTIGYTDLADSVLTSGISSAAVLNPAGNYIAPSVQSATTAIQHISANTTFPSSTGSWAKISMVNATGTNDYPLSTLIYVFVYQAETPTLGYEPSVPRDQAIHQLLNWFLTTGQSSAVTNDYVPLSGGLVAVDQAGLGTMTFSGSSLPGCS